MKKRKRSMTELVSDITGFPETVSPTTPDIHIIGTRELACEGCICILVYERDVVSLRLRGRVMTVRGEGLSLKSFYRSHITVRGRITDICFDEEGL